MCNQCKFLPEISEVVAFRVVDKMSKINQKTLDESDGIATPPPATPTKNAAKRLGATKARVVAPP